MQRYSADTRYPHIGHTSQIRNHGQGMRVPVRHPKGNWVLDVRAYDDGAAWRYVVPGSGQRRVTGEATTFRIPDGSVVWSHTDTDDYEGQYKTFDVSKPVERTLTMPMTIELPAGGGYACLAESDVMHYSGATRRVSGEGRLQFVFEDDADGWTMDGAFASPWRVCVAVDDLNALANSTIVYNVAAGPDKSLFPQGAKTPWVVDGEDQLAVDRPAGDAQRVGVTGQPPLDGRRVARDADERDSLVPLLDHVPRQQRRAAAVVERDPRQLAALGVGDDVAIDEDHLAAVRPQVADQLAVERHLVMRELGRAGAEDRNAPLEDLVDRLHELRAVVLADRRESLERQLDAVFGAQRAQQRTPSSPPSLDTLEYKGERR